MALHFSANQYEEAYKPTVLRNWEVPKTYPARPRPRAGGTRIISNNRGHLLPGFPAKEGTCPWGHFLGTWHLPKKIDRKTANELSGAVHQRKVCPKAKPPELEPPEAQEQQKEDVSAEDVAEKHEDVVGMDVDAAEPQEQDTSNKENKPGRANGVPYVPGDLTEDHHKLPSHDDLAKKRFEKSVEDATGNYPKYRDDFYRESKKEKQEELSVGEIIEEAEKRTRNRSSRMRNGGGNNGRKLPSPVVAAMSNFSLARKLHKENLEHDPLPDTVTNSLYQKLQMQREQKEPGLALDDANYATGIGWKGHPGYGPTRCTKLKVYRPTTGVQEKKKPENERSSSISSFERKWRFIRQRKVSPIELAICWDLTPEDPNDEPKRTPHIDGSNGSSAPAVFTLVHTPKEDPEESKAEAAGSVGSQQPLFEKAYLPAAGEKEFVLDRPKTCCSVRSEPIMSRRAKSAYNLHHQPPMECCEKPSHVEQPPVQRHHHHQSTPNLSECCGNAPEEKCRRSKLCMACELKKVSLGEAQQRPKTTPFKMAFKAGVPQQQQPLSRYKEKRQDYPEHWRLATVYQHSYKPIQSRKRSLLGTVFK